MGKYYVVKVGRIPGLYEKWSECEEQVKGYPGAEYKSFKNKEEALSFLQENERENQDESFESYEIIDPIDLLEEDSLVAYVGGSFSEEEKTYSYGVILLALNEEKKCLLGTGNDDSYVTSKNVVGEIEATTVAIKYALEKGFRKIYIFYDYLGIKKWATGDWTPKTPVARDYVSFIEEKGKGINIEFYKVRAHGGIKYNQEADELAKKALLKKGVKKNDNGSVSVTGVDVEEVIDICEMISEENEEIKMYHDEEDLSTNLTMQKGKEKIVIKSYNSGKTTIQGKHSSLFSLFMEYIVQLMPSDTEVVELLNDYHDISIPQEQIDHEFKELVPNFDHEKSNDKKLLNTLHQAVYNTLVTGKRPDYTDLVTPGLRVLEAYLYEIAIEKGLQSRTDQTTGFRYFKSVGIGKHVLEAKYHNNFTQINRREYFEKLYSFYHTHRHTLKHWDKSGGTRMITTESEARELLKENLQLVNEYYKVF